MNCQMRSILSAQNGDFVRCEDGISLHSKIVDLTYDDFPTGDGTPKPEKKKEPAEANHKEEAKKEHKESSSEKTPKESQTEPKKKLL